MPRATDPPQKLLVRGVNWLGDAVMTTPALQRLREVFPAARITLLTPAKLAGLWSEHPDVDAVLTFAAGESIWQIARRLRVEQFDTALVLPNSPRSALEPWLARIPRRVGLATAGRAWLLTHAVRPRPGAVRMRKRSASEVQRLLHAPPSPAAPISTEAHQMFHYLHLAAALGADPTPLPPRLQVTAAERENFGRRLGLFPAAPDTVPVFGLNAGAEYGPAKRWPRERFVEAAIELCRQTGCRWILFGGAADVELAGGIAAEISRAVPDRGAPAVVNLAGATTLRELCVALQLCRVVLTNDTGPMHVAAAVGRPVVVPFGSTSPELTGPGLPGDPRHQLLRATAPCAPCFLRECPIDFRCLTGISVAQVTAAVRQAAGL